MQSLIFIDGFRFSVAIEHDDGMGKPWEENDGHGSVRESVCRLSYCDKTHKRPGEVMLNDRFAYDFAGAVKTARKEWGISAERRALFVERAGREPTAGEVAVIAVNADMAYLRGWLNDDWHWCGVVVTLLDVDGEPTRVRESLWGMCSNDEEYLDQQAQELAEQIAGDVGRKKFVTDGARRIRVRA